MKRKNILFISVLLLFFTHCFSYIGWTSSFARRAEPIVLIILSLLLLFINKRLKNKVINLKIFVISFTVLPFISFIPAYVLHNQSFVSSFFAANFTLAYLLFFLYFAISFPPRTLLKILCWFGLIWCLIQCIQQITYPHYWFATRMDTFEKSIEIRNGIYRYNTYGIPFGLIFLFYSFQRFFDVGKKKYLMGIIIGLIGAYLTATRQVIASSVLCLLIGLFIMGKIKGRYLFVFLVVSFFIYLNADSLFGDFIEMTEEVDEDYVRFITYNYFGLEYNKGELLPFLFGNGIDFQSNVFYSPYGNEIMKLQELGLHRSDIGIVGMYSYFGIFYVIAVLSFFIYSIRNRKYIEPYLQMYILYMLMTTVMLFHFGYTAANIVTSCSIFYLIDCSISKNKLSKDIVKNNL